MTLSHRMSIKKGEHKMLDDLTRSVKEAVSDGIQDPLNTTGGSCFENIKGRLSFAAIFCLVFAAVALFIILIVGFFVFKAM